MYPDDIRTSTLSVDFHDVIDEENALISLPCDGYFFNAPSSEAFQTLYKLAYPESTQDDEYPEQVFYFCASPTIINDSGALFFAVASESAVRIIGGKITTLVDAGDRKLWKDISNPHIESVIIQKKELNEIVKRLKEYMNYLL